MPHKYKRGNTYWVAYYDNNKLVRKSLKTKDEATAKFLVNKLENDILLGDSPLPRTKSTKDILGEYLKDCRQRLSAHTVKNYESYLKNLFENVGYVPLKSINERIIRDYLDIRFDEGISKRTAHHTVKFIKQFLNYAKNQNYIRNNPLDKMTNFKVDQEPPSFLSKAEINDIIKHSENETLHPMIATAIYAGLRKSELERLVWGDIDFRRNTITVKKSKSKKFRVIPLHHKLKAILTPYKAPDKDFCFDVTNFRRIWKRIKRRANLKDLRFHELRHTFASHMVMSGVDIVTVSKLLGHADISTTQIYSHLAEEHLKEAIGKLKI